MTILKEFEHCMLCPRECGVNRNAGEVGYCKSDAELHISTVCIHRGEEPAISGDQGICNVFFAGCNMQCIFCQNHQISRNNVNIIKKQHTVESVVDEIAIYLNRGIEAVGFVSPTHFSPYVKEIIKELHRHNYYPITVYNTNGYEDVEVLKQMEEFIDVYLPDFKYIDHAMAKQYSDTADYPDIITKAISEMYRQKGSDVIMNERGQAVTGLIIRHLVLPGSVTDSINILKWIAANMSPSVYISLMSQYDPTIHVLNHQVLNRPVSSSEYYEAVNLLEDLGFENGWVQEMDSHHHYRPDFTMSHPFEGLE